MTAGRGRSGTVNERFLDGTGRLELPFGVSEGPQIDRGANLAFVHNGVLSAYIGSYIGQAGP